MNISSSILLYFKYYYQTHVLHICIPTGLRINMSALQQRSPCLMFIIPKCLAHTYMNIYVCTCYNFRTKVFWFYNNNQWPCIYT